MNAAGIPLTLEQVVATPLETRLCVRGLIPWERTKSLPQPVIAGAGWPAPPQPPARTSRRADGVVVYRVDPAPAEQRAVWVVTFRADPRVALPGETPDGRSWTFRFVMPEANEAR